MFNEKEKKYMMHALGIETWNLHRRRIIPYRNYYGVGGTNSATWEIWESLYCRGYATKSSPTMFHVSIKGLSELSAELGTYIYSENSRWIGSAKNQVFQAIVDNNVTVGESIWRPISCKRIADTKRITLRLVRETTKLLCEEGFITKDYVGGKDIDGNPYCYHGYSLTDKGKKEPYYTECLEKETERINLILK